jgi:hypothetical protein
VRLWNIDRLLLVWLYRLYPSLLEAIIIVQPETVIRWHRRGFRAYWRWKSRRMIRWRTSLQTRQQPPDRYLQIADQPLRRHGRTVSGWTIIRLSRQSGHASKSKAGYLNDGSTGDEFGYAPALRFDGATRSLPTPARCGFGVRFGRPELLRLSPSLWKAEYRQTIEILN